jgi:hypothetical protein
LGLRTAYLTEHIGHLKPFNKDGDCWKTIGNINLFPNGNHVALPPHCPNELVFEKISKEFPSQWVVFKLFLTKNLGIKKIFYIESNVETDKIIILNI